jgi:hypothetical protein
LSKLKIKRDSYRASRGGNTKMLLISCAACNQPLFNYQKDGSGQLIRCYIDRIIPAYREIDLENHSLSCFKCNYLIAKLITYKPENRLAYVIMRGAIKKSSLS